ncbi:Trk system potassium transporter TrkA [Salinarchaeum laminariae]|uniref:Trk system potassium transporter TrkA n=1 Tax=Salinarchaeum laminariae TaxID=869888 RepID=UPI0020BFED2E|nr:Trk system potassium transporter TrkA [Salinarchaeum laminariae]
MRVVIVGAGEVGRSIASNLEGTHDVVVIDTDAAVIDDLTYSMDVLPLHGDGTDVEVLREAGIEEADMLLACTDVDETNIVACGAAKTVADVFTVARVKRRGLLDTWEHAEGAFGVDFMVCTDLLTAEAIFRISGLPRALDVDQFADGLVRMAEFELGPESPIGGKTVAEADQFDSMTFAAVFRDEDLIVPRGDTRLEPGDRVVVIGSEDSIREFADEITAGQTQDADDVVILGGSELGFQIAKVFEDRGYRPRLIEVDHDRARELAERLPNTTVMESDVTDTEFLVREHVDKSDVVVAALGTDEQNLLASLLAERIGTPRTLAVVETVDYADLFEAVGIDAAINPREEVAEEIVRFTRAGQTEKVSILEHDRGEVLEIEIGEESVLANRTIVEAAAELPDCVVIGAISREGELVVPRGATTIVPGDHVVVFADSSVVDEVSDQI